MRILTILGVIFFSLLIILAGILIIVFTMNLVQFDNINHILIPIQYSFQHRLIIGISGLLLILMSLSFARLILGRLKREKTITFTVESGEVTVSLIAIEDLIRRLPEVIPEIKELRSDMIASKKGILVDLRMILKKETNISELTSRLQEIARSKINEVLGREEQIIIKTYVDKVIVMDDKDKKEKESKKELKKEEPISPALDTKKVAVKQLCQNCHKEVNNGDKFCQWCGRYLL